MLELNLILAFILKPLVIVFDDLLLIPFWKLRDKPGMKIMFWSTIIFLIGELACGIDIYIMHKMTFLNEGIHDISMLIAFAGYFFGFYEILLNKIGCFKPECDAFKNCKLDSKLCVKNQQFGIYPVWLFIAGIILGLFPLVATPVIYQTVLSAGYGQTVIGSYLYDRTYNLYILQQIIFPISAIIAFIINIILIIYYKKVLPLIWKISCFGLGALGFVYFRIILINIYHPNVIYTVLGEEILELVFMLLLALWVFPKYKKLLLNQKLQLK